MARIIKVGMAEMNVAASPNILITSGLGSCIGVCLYDPVAKIGGMAHIMLPSSEIGGTKDNPAKYADTAVPALMELMEKQGANIRRLVAKYAGGAQMFSFTNGSSFLKIGERNAEAVKEALEKAGIKILASDTGGSFGRTIEFSTETGLLLVRTLTQGEKIL
ncbi:MAG: chemotaxis protein CheD [Eubacteriales bacterium]|nr:chemotaxis protein CheD [Eubacteriales bacterium]MDN5364158.1 chemotaxis protein CheD [Eubacteriales bacterium]